MLVSAITKEGVFNNNFCSLLESCFCQIYFDFLVVVVVVVIFFTTKITMKGC